MTRPWTATGARAALARGARALAGHLPLFVALAIAALVHRGMFASGYAEGSDTLAHLFRIGQVSRWLRDPGSLFDWTHLWYGGFHQFSLYPYLSYIPAGVLDALTGAPVASMKAVILAAMLLGGSGIYFAALEVLRDEPPDPSRRVAAAGGALAFSLSPAFLGFMFGFGEYSDFVAVGFAPVAFLAFLRAIRSDTRVAWVLYAVALALLGMLHPHVALFATLGSLVYLAFSPRLTGRAAFSIVYAWLLAFVLTLYFWVPFLWLRDSAGDPSLGTPFTDPVWAIAPGDYLDGDWGLRYLGVAALILAAGALLARAPRRESLPLAAMGLAGLVLGMGGRLPLSARVPLLDLANPERALAAVLVAVALLAAIGLHALTRELRRVLPPWQAWLAVAGVAALLVADTYFFQERTASTVQFAGDFVAVNRYLADVSGGPFDRVAFLQDDYNLSAYSPIFSGKPTIEGSQVQGSRLAPDVARASQMTPDPAGLSRSVALFSRLGVRWVVVDGEGRPAQLELLRASGLFEERLSEGRYTVLERTWEPSPLRAAGGTVLTIGEGDDAPLIAALSSCIDIRSERASSQRLDDYTASALLAYQAVILAGPVVADAPTVQATLDQYTEKGGMLLEADAAPAVQCSGDVEGDGREIRIAARSGQDVAQELVVTMGYSPAWQVTVDGRDIESHSASGLTGLRVSEGEHEVLLRYRTPFAQRASQVISSLAWLVVLGWLANGSVREKIIRARER